MALENQWVTYLHRSYKNIKAAILNRMETVVPEITDHSESNVFVIIINAFAGLVEQLNYYIDNVARESYLTTARKYSSMVKLTRLIDYRIRARIGSVVDVKITAVDSSNDPVAIDSTNNPDGFTIDADTLVKDEAGIEFLTQRDVTIFPGASYAVVGARQRVKVTDENIGTTTASADQTYLLDPTNGKYQHNTLQITIQAVTWAAVESFAFSGPQDKHFIVNVNESKEAWVVFGDDVNGEIPPSGQSVLATYYQCEGIDSRLAEDTITVFDTIPTPPTNDPVIDSFEVTNELAAVGGLDEEGIEGIRKHAPLSLRTLDRAVTLQDHSDICLLVPGVGKSATLFESATKQITFYVAPDGGGTAPGQLLTDVADYFELRKMISTFVQAYAAGETLLRITLDVTVRFRRSTSQAGDDIREALQNEFGFNNSNVDRPIRRSDIIALVDNVEKVDFLSLGILTTKPFPRIIQGSNPLEDNWYVEVQSNSSEIAYWRIGVQTDTATAKVWRTGPSGEEVQESTLLDTDASDPTTTDWTSDDGTLKLGAFGTFTQGDEWSFKTYPYNEDIVFEDFTVPIYSPDELTLTVNPSIGID